MYNHRYHIKKNTPYDPTWHRNGKIIFGFENGTHVTDLTAREAVKFIKWFNDPKGIIQKEKSRDKRLLLATVHHVDSAAGEILDALEDSKVREART